MLHLRVQSGELADIHGIYSVARIVVNGVPIKSEVHQNFFTPEVTPTT